MKLNFGENIIGDDEPVCIIAEAAVEHVGSLQVAKRMIDVAEKAQVDFIKFQYHIPEAEMLPNTINFWGGNMDTILENYNLKHSDHVDLIKYCEDKKIQYLCTPFSPEAVHRLNDIGVQGFKTGSGELTNIPLFEAIKSTGKPVIVSTGMATVDEIKETHHYLSSNNISFMFMNCTSVYPCPYDQVYLKNIQEMKEKYGVLVGHSDHTPDLITSLGAVVAGASVIEKHFTMSKLIGGPDATVSLEPDDLLGLVKQIRLIEQANTKRLSMSEQEKFTKSWANHSVVSAKEIEKGKVITANDLTVKRPSGGIPANRISDIIGKLAKREIKKNHQVSYEDFSKE